MLRRKILMRANAKTAPSAPYFTSPLMLADRLLALAQDADRAGYVSTADRLLKLALKVLENTNKAKPHEITQRIL
jgi:hypothetical protein